MSKNCIRYGLSAEQRGRRNRSGEEKCELSVAVFRLRCLRDSESEDRLCGSWFWGAEEGDG